MENGIYTALYDIIATYIFGTVATGTYQELVCILLATLGSVVAIATPFFVAFGFLKMCVRW